MSETTFLTELRCAEAIAREAGKRIELGRAHGFIIDHKGTNDLVTNVDREVETFLREQLRELFPEDELLGEEYGAEEGEGEANRRRWLIDPIDGTTNFSKGIPVYCVSIALRSKGQPVVGVIYDPTRDELFSARRGGGAHLNGAPMQVSDEESLGHAVVITGFPPVKTGDGFEKIVQRFGHMARASRGVRRFGSAALDMAYVAAGRIDASWEFNLNPWDTAAGHLLVQEAGGRVSDVNGEHFTPFGESVVASNGRFHDSIIKTFCEAGIA